MDGSEKAVLAFMERVVCAPTLAAMAETVCRAVRDLVPCDAASFNHVGADVTVAAFDPVDVFVPASAEAVSRHADAHPLILHYAQTGTTEPVALDRIQSDLAFFNGAVFDQVYRPSGLRRIVSVCLPTGPETFVAVALMRGGGRFSDTDLSLLHRATAVLAPVLMRGIKAEIADGLALLGHADDVVTTSGCVVTRLPPLAAARLQRLGIELRVGATVPDRLAQAMAHAPAGIASTVLRGADRLTDVDVVARPRPAPSLIRIGQPRPVAEPRLTDRERQVLLLTREGLTNQQIAEHLTLSPLTVKKHLERIYSRLGVHSRTEAVRAAAAQLGDASPVRV